MYVLKSLRDLVKGILNCMMVLYRGIIAFLALLESSFIAGVNDPLAVMSIPRYVNFWTTSSS